MVEVGDIVQVKLGGAVGYIKGQVTEVYDNLFIAYEKGVVNKALLDREPVFRKAPWYLVTLTEDVPSDSPELPFYKKGSMIIAFFGRVELLEKIHIPL